MSVVLLQAIQTHYLGPTNKLGSRIRAYCRTGTITVPFNHSLREAENHLSAAQKLINKIGWADLNDLQLVGGVLPNGDCTFVMFTNDQVYPAQG